MNYEDDSVLLNGDIDCENLLTADGGMPGEIIIACPTHRRNGVLASFFHGRGIELRRQI
jgi:hypothetical protein